MSNVNNSINYIEFPMVDKDATKQFYGQVLGWKFTEWGPAYISFSGAGVEGGFNGKSAIFATEPGVLVVLYVDDLPLKLKEVQDAGGEIIKPIYSFPGGTRLHFLDPSGNELAVWSE